MFIPNAINNLIIAMFFFSLLFPQPTGFMELAVSYSSIEDVHVVSRWDAGHKFCLRITIQDGSVLLQVCISHRITLTRYNKMFMKSRERERERDRERETGRQTERQTGRQRQRDQDEWFQTGL